MRSEMRWNGRHLRNILLGFHLSYISRRRYFRRLLRHLHYFFYAMLANHLPLQRMSLFTFWCYLLRFPRIVDNAFLNKIILNVSACMSKEAIFLLIIWEGVRVMFELHPVFSCLSFSPSNVSAVFVGTTLFQQLLIFLRHLSLKSSVMFHY